MADESFWWIYLVFFMIPLARILPRLLRRVRGGGGAFEPRHTPSSAPEARIVQEARVVHEDTPEKKVLGQLGLGIIDYTRIRENLGMEPGQLDPILADLEKKGLMRPVRKAGLFGTRIELHITEDGTRRYHS